MLELLSLGQTQDATALTITGLVQNPRNGAELSKIKATALLFGRPDGTFFWPVEARRSTSRSCAPETNRDSSSVCP